MIKGESELFMWTVSYNTSDFPGLFCARKWAIGAAEYWSTGLFVTGKTLDEVRNMLPCGLTRFAKHPSEDRTIVETWI